MRLIITLVPVLALVGCMTPEQEQEKFSTTCEGYGFKPGTTEFAQCMQNEAVMQENRDQRAAEAFATGFSNGWSRPAAPPPRPTTTNCRQWGNNMRCTTY